MSVPVQFPAPFEVYPYLTNVPSRRPEQKLHSTLGHAKNAIHGTGIGYDYAANERKFAGGQIYRWSPEKGEWELVYDVPHGTLNSALPWKLEA